MTTFFSFFKRHIFPSKNMLRALVARPLTWYGFIFCTLLVLICLVVYILILRINSHFLVTIPARGGTVTEGIIGAPHNINPVTATTDTDISLTALLYSGLMKEIPDGVLVPDLASSYTVSADKTQYTFRLKDRLKWSDGTPLDSHDVAFTIGRLADPALHSDPFWQQVNVSTPDPHTIVFTLPSPSADFLREATVGIIPQHIWGTIPDEQFDRPGAPVVGSGPYKEVGMTYQHDVPSELFLKYNSHYAGTRPYIDSYNVAFFANQQQLLDALNAGTIDITLAADSTTAEALHNSAFHSEKIASSSIIGLFKLSKSPLLTDTLLQTLDASIDKTHILATVENGYGMLPAVSSGHFTPADAAAALQKQGFSIDNGVLKKGATPVTFSIAVENNPDRLLAAHTLADEFAKLGIAVSVNAFDKGTFQEVLRADTYPLFIGNVRDSGIPEGYQPALILYTKAYPLIVRNTLHVTLPEYLDSPNARYETVESWYATTDRVWKIFQPKSN